MLWCSIAAAELRRGWLIKRRYPLNFIFSVMGGMIFLITVAAGAMLVMDGRLAVDRQWAIRIFGLVLAGGAGHALSAGVGFINAHTHSGTLEQVALSPVALPALVALKLVISFLLGLPYLTIYGVGLWLLFPGFVPLPVLLTAPLVVYLGMMGLGLAVTGLAMLAKQIESVLGLIGLAMYPLPLLISSDVLGLPIWSAFPYTLGLQFILGVPVSWAVVALIPVLWLVVGLCSLSMAEQAARRRGVLGLY